MSQIRILVVQRRSHVSSTPFSRSVAARITEALDYLARQNMVSWFQKGEKEVTGADLDHVDAVFFSKHLSGAAVEIAKAAKKRNIAIVYDLDDWVVSFPAYSGANVTADLLDNFRCLMELSDVVTVANERLLYKMRVYRQELELVRTASMSKNTIQSVSKNHGLCGWCSQTPTG